MSKPTIGHIHQYAERKNRVLSEVYFINQNML